MALNRITRSLAAAVALAAILITFAVWPGPRSERAEAVDDPVAVVEAFADALNAGIPTAEGAAAAAFFAEDGYIVDIGNESFGIFGRSTIESLIGSEADPDFQVTILEIAAVDGTATGTFEFTDANAIDAGIDRYLQPFTAVVVDKLITSLTLTYDESDPQTAAFLAHQASQEDGDDEPPPGGVVFTLAGDQAGQGFLAGFEGTTFLGVEIAPGDELQPAAVYAGTCDALGEVATQLAPLLEGASFSILGLTQDELVDGDYVVSVQASESDTTQVSCGEIEALAATATPPPTAAPTPTISLPETGATSSTGDGNDMLAISLALAGVAAVATLAGGARLLRKGR